MYSIYSRNTDLPPNSHLESDMFMLHTAANVGKVAKFTVRSYCQDPDGYWRLQLEHRTVWKFVLGFVCQRKRPITVCVAHSQNLAALTVHRWWVCDVSTNKQNTISLEWKPYSRMELFQKSLVLLLPIPVFFLITRCSAVQEYYYEELYTVYNHSLINDIRGDNEGLPMQCRTG